jgi:hypothetical protein
VHYWQSNLLKGKVRELIAMDGRSGIESVFKRLYSRKIADGDELTMGNQLNAVLRNVLEDGGRGGGGGRGEYSR